MISFKKCSPYQAEISAMIDELDRFQGSLYPEASNYHDSKETLNQPNCHFISANENLDICGIGAIKIFSDYGEIKRVYVPQRFRGKGIAAFIIKELENHLTKNGITLARLETGIHHIEAINLYSKLGYYKISPFADYEADPLSVFMEKKLYLDK